MEQKFEFSANTIVPYDDHIEVNVVVNYSELAIMPVAILQIVVDRYEGKSVEFYEQESIKAAKKLIKDIAEDLNRTEIQSIKHEAGTSIAVNQSS